MQGRTVRSARESAVALAGPLHRRAGALALVEGQIVAHPDLVAILQHRRARQREEHRECQLQPPPVIAEHGRQPSADPPVVELHGGLGRQRLKDPLALLRRQATEVELVV
jgi:hypothetical protein